MMEGLKRQEQKFHEKLGRGMGPVIPSFSTRMLILRSQSMKRS